MRGCQSTEAKRPQGARAGEIFYDGSWTGRRTGNQARLASGSKRHGA